MTVAEFIEWLKTQDQGAIVCVVVQSDRDDGAHESDFDPVDGGHWAYQDWRLNSAVEPHRLWYQKRYLTLGATP